METQTQTDLRYANGLEALRTELKRARINNLKPPAKLRLSEWANTFGVLSAETSAQTGRFRSLKYQDGIMDAITDPVNNEITVMKSARVGYTKILDHVVGYYIHQDPSPILIVQPRVEDAEDYSKTEISPMLRDTPVLAQIAGDQKAKDSAQTILKKIFRNGASITFVGANSPGGFRRITARIVGFDEVDGYPAGGAGSEGDQIALGTKRSETFWNRKIIKGSTPTVKGVSRIEKEWLRSDQRRFFFKCPHCGAEQYLEWGGPDIPHGMKWDKDANGAGRPSTAHYVCRENGCVIEESEKFAMFDAGEWKPTNPKGDHPGFHIWAGYSYFPNASWKNIVAEWLKVKNDPLARQTFVNLVLGEPYEDRGEGALHEKKLATRCEMWDAEIPNGVALLTAGLDTQDDRIEIEVVGWGKNEESWSVSYEVFEGDPESPDVWEEVDTYLKRKFYRADGRAFTIKAACFDSGGHHTQKVYDFCRARLGRRIYAIKGESARGGQRNPVWPTKKPQARNKTKFRPIILGVNAAKDVIRARLNLEEYGAGYMHFPASRDIGYFSQLLAERLTTVSKNGQRYRVWDPLPGRANEALDCRVYAYGALCGLLHMGLRLNVLAQQIATPDETALPVTITQIEKGKQPDDAPREAQPRQENEQQGVRITTLKNPTDVMRKKKISRLA